MVAAQASGPHAAVLTSAAARGAATAATAHRPLLNARAPAVAQSLERRD